MSASKCGACGHGSFEIKTKEPTGSRFKLNYLQCASCGAVVGVTDYSDVATLVMSLAEQLKNVERGIEGRLSRIEAALTRR